MSLELLAVFANVRGSLPTQKEVEADGGQERYRGRNLKPAHLRARGVSRVDLVL